MSTGEKEILINEEALKRVNKCTMELKQKMNSALEDVSKSNKDFISNSKGEFASTFEEITNSFESDMREQIDKLNEINSYAETVLESNMELDRQIAGIMRT